MTSIFFSMLHCSRIPSGVWPSVTVLLISAMLASSPSAAVLQLNEFLKMNHSLDSLAHLMLFISSFLSRCGLLGRLNGNPCAFFSIAMFSLLIPSHYIPGIRIYSNLLSRWALLFVCINLDTANTRQTPHNVAKPLHVTLCKGVTFL